MKIKLDHSQFILEFNIYAGKDFRVLSFNRKGVCTLMRIALGRFRMFSSYACAGSLNILSVAVECF